jgi:hypothetical protein
MSLNDGDIAALAERAAARIDGPVDVRIEPDPGNDPYRWGSHYWLVHVRAGEARQVTVRLAAEDTEAEADARLAAAVDGL